MHSSSSNQGSHYLILAQLHNDVHVLLVLKHIFKLNHMLVSQRLVNLDLRLKLIARARIVMPARTQSGPLVLAVHVLSTCFEHARHGHAGACMTQDRGPRRHEQTRTSTRKSESSSSATRHAPWQRRGVCAARRVSGRWQRKKRKGLAPSLYGAAS